MIKLSPTAGAGPRACVGRRALLRGRPRKKGARVRAGAGDCWPHRLCWRVFPGCRPLWRKPWCATGTSACRQRPKLDLISCRHKQHEGMNRAKNQRRLRDRGRVRARHDGGVPGLRSTGRGAKFKRGSPESQRTSVECNRRDPESRRTSIECKRSDPESRRTSTECERRPAHRGTT
jgi:hypothetical protein